MIYFILWIKGLKGTAISKKVYTIFIFHLILITIILFELIVIKASSSMPSKFSLSIMVFKLKLIAVNLVKGEAIASL